MVAIVSPLIGRISLTLRPSTPRRLDRYCAIVCEVLVRVVHEYAVLLQESMDLHAGLKAEQFAGTSASERRSLQSLFERYRGRQ